MFKRDLKDTVKAEAMNDKKGEPEKKMKKEATHSYTKQDTKMKT